MQYSGMVWFGIFWIGSHNTSPHPDPARSSPITLCNAKTARNEAEIRIGREKLSKDPANIGDASSLFHHMYIVVQ